MVPSYNEIFHVAHKAIQEMWEDPVEIQEKVDGSQINWQINSETDELEIRSKGQQIHEGSPSSQMFNPALESIKARTDLLVPGQVWRGEFLSKPKHNTIKYDRTPKDHIVIFDIELSLGEYATPEQRKEMAEFIGYEPIPVLYQGQWTQELSNLKLFLEHDSFLGGSKIEGIVVKCYTQLYGHKPMMGKLVSDAFKEIHNKEWKKGNPGKKDVIENIIDMYRVEARWRKAIQHLKERGELTHSPKDIGPLLKEISQDVLKEEEDAIKEELFRQAWPRISRGVGRGLPDWYKDDFLFEEE